MKLRNKKNGEILDDVQYRNFSMHDGFGLRNQDGKEYYYHSLAELNEEWEDYKEPKEYWIPMSDEPYPFVGNDWEKEGLSTGLISLSKEENEIKRDKLKAWKRLKDKGFRFNRWTIPEEPKTPHIKLVIEAEMDVPDSPYDLDLLFGGEE